VIYIFEGVPQGLETDYVDRGLTPVLNALEQLARWRGTSRPAALHVDTGMTRLGLSPGDVGLLVSEPGLLDGIELDCLMTHLACADQPEHALNAVQLERFEQYATHLPATRRSIANSAAAFGGQRFAADLVRPGIALYGGNPFVDRASPVEPVATLKARVLQLRDVDAAASIGYGATYVAESPARIAVLGIGYADGYPRCLGNRGVATIAGVEVPIVGRVSMDLLCVDVSAVDRSRVEVGQYAELFGTMLSIDDVAAAAGTISYELLTHLGSRLKRHYLGAD
jgi:alanine racemase